jgi:uncharacterized short protein YbdD (DUF466 family)
MRAVEVARGVRWYVRGLLGEDAYEKYVDHVRGEHGDGEPVMTEREFWRDRDDRHDSNPQGRCC